MSDAALAIALAARGPSARAAEGWWDRAAAFERRPSMREQGYPPHLTFGLYPAGDAMGAEDAMAAVFGGAGALRIRFSRIAAFEGASPVLYLVPERDEALRGMHDALSARLPATGHYAPAAWTPHLTIALAVDPAKADAARAFAGETIDPIDVTFDRVELVRLPTLNVAAAITLTPEAE